MYDVIAGQGAARAVLPVLHLRYARRLRAYLTAYVCRTYRQVDADLVAELVADTWRAARRALSCECRPGPRPGGEFGWLAGLAREAVVARRREARAARVLPAVAAVVARRQREVLGVAA